MYFLSAPVREPVVYSANWARVLAALAALTCWIYPCLSLHGHQRALLADSWFRPSPGDWVMDLPVGVAG